MKDLIQVHHLVPLSAIGKKYRVDPIRDLRPVCPNSRRVWLFILDIDMTVKPRGQTFVAGEELEQLQGPIDHSGRGRVTARWLTRLLLPPCAAALHAGFEETLAGCLDVASAKRQA